MVSKITEGLFNSVYFKVSLVILVTFFVATWYVNIQLEKEAVQSNNAIMNSVALNNIQVTTNMLDNYGERLTFLKATLGKTTTTEALQKSMLQMQNIDPSINSIYLEPLDPMHKDSTKLWREVSLKNNRYFLKFSLALDPNHKLSMLVDLMGFHQKISEMDTKSLNAYITIAWGEVYLYHPDEKKIGTKVSSEDILNGKKALVLNKNLIEKVNSDFLNMPVYRYYYPMDAQGGKWMFTANIPNLDLIESIRKMGNSLLIISLLAIFSFLSVFSMGILRWRKEFIRRREIEQQNMSLQLKDEQYKQTMITAELERLKSGLNPHFLFNSLSSLRVLVSKDSELAKDFAITLSSLYRYMLRHEYQNTVSLKDELEFTEDYISLQKIRFANKIKTDISLPESLMNRKVPPISLQLLVENCIKHTKISDTEPLRIHIFEENDLLVVTNNYNPRESETEYSGKGIENLIKRYSFLTQTNCHFGVNDNYYIAKIPLLFIS